MGSIEDERVNKPHAVCIPFPVQSHINAMLNVAKLVHQRGFYITFVNTEYNHRRILKSRGPNSLDGFHGFQFRAISDGLSTSDSEPSQEILCLLDATFHSFLSPFCALLSQLNDASPPVSCIIADGGLPFAIGAALEFHIPIAHFWPISASSFLCFMQIRELVERGITPLKDESYLTNGYLETTVDWIPGMKNIRLKDLPTLIIRTTNPDDIFLNYCIQATDATREASAIILNTFDALDQDVLDALSCLLPPIYTIGPLHLFSKQIKNQSLESVGTNLWKETTECIAWLDSNEPSSVIYINFGSLTVITVHQLTEFACGLSKSEKPFLWIIRPDLVEGDSTNILSEFVEETKERGMISSWCCQEEVLKHRSIGGFLTHCGWNSTIESICAGVPMISWPLSGDQPTTCRYSDVEWGIGMELNNDVNRDDVQNCVRELMEGEKGRDMKKKVMELERKAKESYKPGGTSYLNINKLITEILQRK